MTESNSGDDIFANKDPSPPRVARVFFDQSADWMEFHTVRARPVSMATEMGKVTFDTLTMRDGAVLAPAIYLDESGEDKVLVDFGRELEPVNNIVNGQVFESPLLRTREQSENMRLVEAVRMLGKNRDALDMHLRLTRDEWLEAERYHRKLRQLLESRKELWIRLDAGPGADPHLAGQIMIAKLAIFVTEFRGDGASIGEQGVPGIFPLVYDHGEHRFGFIPEQLVVPDPWVYIKLDEDPEYKKS